MQNEIMKNSVDHLLPNALVFQGCDSAVALGIESFVNRLTSSYSLTSRRYSVWSLVRELLDTPVADYVDGLPWPMGSNPLANFRPSKMGKHSPLSGSRRCLPNTPEVEWIIGNLEDWREYLRFVIHNTRIKRRDSNAADGHPPMVITGKRKLSGSLGNPEHRPLWEFESSETSPCDSLFATLDSLIRLIDELEQLRPRTACNRSQSAANQVLRSELTRLRVPDGRTRPLMAKFCELCWRPTQQYELAVSEGHADHWSYAGARALSDRFCRVHDPSDRQQFASEYRADLYFRDHFHHELLAQMGLRQSAYLINFPLPAHSTRQDRRKAAYDLVHAFPRGGDTPENRQAGFVEQVFSLHTAGAGSREMQQGLGISRQAISKALKQAERLMETRALEARVDRDTHEPFSEHCPESVTLLEEVQRLANAGYSTARIAQRVNRFKHTVRAAMRWSQASKIVQWDSRARRFQRRPYSNPRRVASRLGSSGKMS